MLDPMRLLLALGESFGVLTNIPKGRHIEGILKRSMGYLDGWVSLGFERNDVCLMADGSANF